VVMETKGGSRIGERDVIFVYVYFLVSLIFVAPIKKQYFIIISFELTF